MWYAIVAILILIADQGLKYWVTLNIPLDTGHVTLIPGVLELTNIHNNGAAFSILQHAPHWIFVIFTVVFAAIAVFCLRRNVVHGKVGRWSVVLVLAGAVGNCIDSVKLFLSQLSSGLVHRKAHICSRIAVGYGEYVKFVYLLSVLSKRGIGAQDHVLEHRSV